eukprot:14889503-Alexandrium_andersonii.AAC.1
MVAGLPRGAARGGRLAGGAQDPVHLSRQRRGAHDGARPATCCARVATRVGADAPVGGVGSGRPLRGGDA